MGPQEAFNYDSALTRLIQLRYESRRQGGDEANPEIMDLERQIYAYVRNNAQNVGTNQT